MATPEIDIFKIFKDIQYQKPNSASASYIFKATYIPSGKEMEKAIEGGGGYKEWLMDGCKCFMKAYYPSEKNLEYEQKIYKYLSDKANEDDYLNSAFIIPIQLIKDYKFPEIPKEINGVTRTIISQIIRKNKQINIIITRTYSDMQSLFNTLEEINKTVNPISIDIMTSILFQVLYAIFYMHTVLKLVHNDLHLDNILVKKYETPQTIKYSYLDKEYTIKTFYRIYMYDFDRGSTSSLGENEFIKGELYRQNGIINGITNYDVYCFLFNISDFILSNQMKQYFSTKIEIISRLYLHIKLVNEKRYIWQKYCKLLSNGHCNDNLSGIEEDYDINAYLKDIIKYMTENKLFTPETLKNKYLKYKTKYLQLKKEYLQLK